MGLWRYLRTAIILSTLVLATACANLPDDRQVKQFLGLEQSFAHNDVPAPPTPAAYVLQMGVSRAQRIVVRTKSGVQQREVTDPRVIQAVLSVIRAGAAAQAPDGAHGQQTPLQLDFVIDSPKRLVTAHYNPANLTLQIYNVPAPTWPDHAVAAYTMTPAFSVTLEQALGEPGELGPAPSPALHTTP